MNKAIISRYLAEAIPVAAFNIVFFLLTEDFTASRWIGWACLHVAYLAFVVVLRGVGSAERKAVFGYPKAGVAFWLFLATLAAFVGIFVVNPEAEKWAVVAEVVATAWLGVMYFSLDVAEDSTRRSEGVVRRHCVFIATTAQTIGEARRLFADAGLRKVVERAYDAVRNGNVASVPMAAEVEAEISVAAGRLAELAKDGGGGESKEDDVVSLAKSIVDAMGWRETIIRSARSGRTVAM